jgi:hypothetical protein
MHLENVQGFLRLKAALRGSSEIAQLQTSDGGWEVKNESGCVCERKRWATSECGFKFTCVDVKIVFGHNPQPEPSFDYLALCFTVRTISLSTFPKKY